MAFPEGTGQRPKLTTSPPKRVQAKMLRTLRESSDSEEEQDRKRAYFVLARVESSIRNEKVDLTIGNVKVESAAEFIPRICTPIAHGADEKIDLDLSRVDV